MTKYRFKIKQTRIEFFDVIADTKQEALAMAKSINESTDLFNDSGTIIENEFEIVDESNPDNI